MRHVLLGLLILLCFPVMVYSISVDPSDLGVGARPLGMGKAFVGLADDASALFLNPSGLANIETPKFMSMNGKLLLEADYLVGGFAAPLPFGVIGISYANIGVGDIPLTTLNGTIPAYAGSSVDYSNRLLLLSYARYLENFFIFKDMSIGGSLKYYSQSFSGIAGGNGAGMDMDLAMHWYVNDATKMGVMLQNILPVSMGGKFVWQKNSYEESIPCLIKIGGCFNFLGEKGYYYSSDQKIDFLIDTDMYYSLGRPGTWHLGVEWWPREIIALRIGIDQKPRGDASGATVDSNLTLGVGVNFRGFTFDYAYHKFSNIEENSTHFFSLGFVGSPIEYKTQKKNLEYNPILSLRLQ